MTDKENIKILGKKYVRLILDKISKIKKRVINNYDKIFNKVEKEDIIKKLRELGIKEGNTLYVHSSMSSFGYVTGGQDTVIDSLLEIVGKEGNIIMPTFNYINSKEPRLNLFDPEKTPCETGKIAEAFRLRKSSKRSIHPLASVAAIGPMSAYLTAGHENTKTPFAEDSPYGKMINDNTYILNLGTEHNSFMHYIQEKVNFPNLFLNGLFRFRYKKNNKIEDSLFKIHHPLSSTYLVKQNKKTKKLDTHEFYVNLYREIKLKEKGITKTTKIGKANVRLLKMKGLIKYSIPYIKENILQHKKQYNSLISTWNKKHKYYFRELKKENEK